MYYALVVLNEIALSIPNSLVGMLANVISNIESRLYLTIANTTGEGVVDKASIYSPIADIYKVTMPYMIRVEFQFCDVTQLVLPTSALLMFVLVSVYSLVDNHLL